MPAGAPAPGGGIAGLLAPGWAMMILTFMPFLARPPEGRRHAASYGPRVGIGCAALGFLPTRPPIHFAQLQPEAWPPRACNRRRGRLDWLPSCRDSGTHRRGLDLP